MKIRLHLVLKYMTQVLIWLFAFICILLLTLYIYVFVSKDKLQNQFTSYINSYLLTEVQVKKIDITVFQKFPYISLYFDEVIIPEVLNGEQGEDTLLFAKHIYLQFNIIDFLRKNYSVKKISIEQNRFYVKKFADGTNNYEFWKSDTTATEPALHFELQSVMLYNTNLRYIDKFNDITIKADIHRMLLAGNFKKEIFTTRFQSAYTMSFFQIGETVFDNSINMEVTAVLKIDATNQYFEIQKGHMQFEQIRMEVDGDVRYVQGETDIQLAMYAKKVKVKDFFTILPANIREQFIEFDKKGQLEIEVGLHGQFSENSVPQILIHCKYDDGIIRKKGMKSFFDKVMIDIEMQSQDIRKSETIQIICHRFSAAFSNGSINGSFSAIGFPSTKLRLALNANLSIDEFYPYVKTEQIHHLKGRLKTDLQFVGHFADIRHVTKNDMQSVQSTGNFSLNNVELGFKNFNELIYMPIVNATYQTNSLQIDSLLIRTCQSDMSLSGKVNNFFHYILLDNQKLIVSGKGISKILQPDLIFIANNTEKSGNDEQTVYFELPSFLQLDFSLEIEQFRYQTFSANNSKCIVIMNDNRLYLQNLTLETLDGIIQSNITIDASNPEFIELHCNATCKHINIQKGFKSFGNFGQNSLTDKNVQGYLSGKLTFNARCTRNLDIDASTVRLTADIEVVKGVIQNYEPLSGLRRYIKNKNFEYVEFDKLQNEISISNREVTIPTMLIQAKDMRFKMLGKHDFDNNIDYRFQIELSELLKKEGQSKAKAEDEYGTIVDDGLGRTTWHFRVTGTVDNPKFIPLDIQSVTKKIEHEYKQEKEVVKELLQEEFKQFRKETIEYHEKEQSKRILIEWDDE